MQTPAPDGRSGSHVIDFRHGCSASHCGWQVNGSASVARTQVDCAGQSTADSQASSCWCPATTDTQVAKNPSPPASGCIRQVVAPSQSVPNGVHSSRQAWVSPTCAQREPSAQSNELEQPSMHIAAAESDAVPAVQVMLSGQVPSLAQGNGPLVSGSSAHAAETNARTLADALNGADAVFGLSAKGAFSDEMIRAIVHTGEFRDPAAEKAIADIMIAVACAESAVLRASSPAARWCRSTCPASPAPRRG